MLRRLSSTKETARRLSLGDKSTESSLEVNITEPALFIPTYTNKPPVLRGSCVLDVREPLTARRLTVTLRGTSRVQWPHGTQDTEKIIDCTLTVFGPEASKTGPQSYAVCSEEEPPALQRKESGFSRRKSQLRTALMDLYPNSNQPPAAAYHTFKPGTYRYNFEMVLHSQLPQTIRLRGSQVRYSVHVCVERPGALTRNITHTQPITAIHCPAEDYVEDAEPVYVRRSWSKYLRCEILVSRRGAPLGHRLPVTLSFTELAQAKLRGIRVYLSENVQYLQKDGLPSCFGPYKRTLVYKAVDGVGSAEIALIPEDDQVKHLVTDEKEPDSIVACSESTVQHSGAKATTLDFDLPLPICRIHANGDETRNMHFDTKYKNVQVNHWIEFVFLLTKDASGEVKTQKSIKTPLTLRPCYANQANASLPAYSETTLCDSLGP
ncbi:arrestin domain-containing protein [Aspergillus taichungensis]|uniref:Arrestin domain-containing protein n=1 Tax=Aspergillus taichungensis TaxID=482145 RepID=A0A2J5I7W0_9EURO|nr:arrestin domain-containing protein [Aspergillus taichungensis]